MSELWTERIERLAIAAQKSAEGIVGGATCRRPERSKGK